MPALTWIALAFFLVATTGAGVYAGLRGWRTLKTFGSVAGSLGRALDRVFQGADAAAGAAAALPERSQELERELTGLAESRAQLGVLLGALGRARTTLDGFRGVVYGK